MNRNAPQINVRSHEDFAATAMTHSASSAAAAGARAGGGGGGGGGGRGKRWFSQSSVLSSSETRYVEGDAVDCK